MSLRMKIVAPVMAAFCVTAVVIGVSVYALQAIPALAAGGLYPQDVKDYCDGVVRILLLVGVAGFGLTLAVACGIAFGVSRHLVAVVAVLSESGPALADAARGDTEELAKVAAAQGRALTEIVEVLAALLMGKPLSEYESRIGPPPHGGPKTLSAADIIPLGDDDF